jgi:hypothetical protein
VTIVGVSQRGFAGANVGTIADITVPVAALPRVQPEAASLLDRGNFCAADARPAGVGCLGARSHCPARRPLAAIGFGTAPALRAAATVPSAVLKADARMSGPPSRLLPALVVGQIALSIVLLVGAARPQRRLREAGLKTRPRGS